MKINTFQTNMTFVHVDFCFRKLLNYIVIYVSKRTKLVSVL